MTDARSLVVEPIVSYPRAAEPGKSYLLSIDLRFPYGAEAWPYEREEHEIHCLVDSSPLFTNEELGEAVIVLHRFGGSYGPARFLLTANHLELADANGAITLTLASREGVPLQVLRLDDIRVASAPASAGDFDAYPVERVTTARATASELNVSPADVVATAPASVEFDEYPVDSVAMAHSGPRELGAYPAGALTPRKGPDAAIHSVNTWKQRLGAALEAADRRPIVFVVGDGLARDKSGGAWSVKHVLEAINEDYRRLEPLDLAESDVDRQLERLMVTRGRAEVARLFRRAVLAACRLPESDPRWIAALEPRTHRQGCERLMANPDDWYLPVGVAALADIVATIQERRQRAFSLNAPPLLVTTNFDPLLELALRQKGVPINSYSIVNDRGPDHGGDGVGLWHVHGAWTDVTINTPHELPAERYKLSDALRRRCDGADVFVIGYGGWHDIVFSTLGEMLAEHRFDTPPEILWAFFDGNEKTLRNRYAHVFDLFSGPLAGCQVTFYAGVDAHRDLPEVALRIPGLSDAAALGSESALPALWTVPFRPNPHFKGRAVELEAMNRAWGSTPSGPPPRPQVLCGLGGVGKTQLVVEYAWRYRSRYDAVLWIDANTPESVQANIAALVERLGVPRLETQDQAASVEAVRRWLRESSRWLLVFDNVDTEEAQIAVLNVLPKPAFGHVLITSRTSDWPMIKPMPLILHRLDVLSDSEASEFLVAATGDTPTRPASRDAVALARRLGGLPLALEQATAYIVRNRVSFAQYLRQLDTAPDLLTHRVRGATELDDMRATVVTTWRATETELGLGARALLRLVSFFAPEQIPRHALVRASAVLQEAVRLLRDDLTNRHTDDRDDLVESSLVELDKYSLITLRSETFSCHRLVMEEQRLRIGPHETSRWLTLAFAVFQAAFPGSPEDAQHLRGWEALRPHIARVVEAAERANISESTAYWMRCLGIFYYTKAMWRDAESLLRRALTIDEESLGADHPNVARGLSSLALLLKDTNRHAEAERMMRRALTIDEKSLGAHHPDVAIDLNNLAQLLRETNRYGEAEPLVRRALAIDEQGFGADYTNVAISLNNLAQLLKDTNRYGEAEPLMWQALSMDERKFGPNHPSVAHDLNNLAMLLNDTKRFGEGEPLMRRALTIDENSFGPDHPNVARDLNNLGMLLKDTNRHGEAEPLMRRALAIDEKSFGPDHPNVAIRLNNLAQLLVVTARYDEAERLLRRAFDIFERSLGPEHPHSLMVRRSLQLPDRDTSR
jgi:tetratricopeptide (TPR) repeat protein